MKILTLDIETFPAEVYAFDLRTHYIGAHMVKEPDRMCSFAAKWYGKKKIHYFSEYHHSPDQMVEAVHAMLDEADVVVTYNGDNFDLPHIYRAIELYNARNLGNNRLLEPSDYVSVDLYKVIKKHQKWLSHKLGYITQQLSLTGKLAHQGMELWIRCMHFDRAAWSEFRAYNKQDVLTTEEVLDLCWAKIHNIPVPITFEGEPLECICGSNKIQRRGFRRTKTRIHQRFQCQSCGHWWKKRLSERGEAAQIS